MTENSNPNAVVIERTFDAPIELVWQAWTVAEHFQAWYGPMGATIPMAKMDVKVGGRRHIGMEMETPGGTMQMWFTGEYREIVPNERLVYTESMADEEGNAVPPAELGMPEGHPAETEVIVQLEDLGGKTRVVLTHVGVPADSPGAQGWSMALDKLSTHLA
ncbi:MAG: SRPBCC domain-containing protein [Actinomycetota bacterium]